MSVNLTKDDRPETPAPGPMDRHSRGMPIALQAAILAAGALAGAGLGFWYLRLSPLSLLP
jgi:hypothetical protein